jgi:hypothetical protein
MVRYYYLVTWAVAPKHTAAGSRHSVFLLCGPSFLHVAILLCGPWTLNRQQAAGSPSSATGLHEVTRVTSDSARKSRCSQLAITFILLYLC